MLAAGFLKRQPEKRHVDFQRLPRGGQTGRKQEEKMKKKKKIAAGIILAVVVMMAGLLAFIWQASRAVMGYFESW